LARPAGATPPVAIVVFWKIVPPWQGQAEELKVLSTDKDTGDAGQADTGTAIVTIDDATAALLKRIKAHAEKGDRARALENQHRAKAEQHDTSMGLLLTQLKGMHPDNWEFLAREHAGVGRSRAYELIAIADGRTDANEQRAKNAEANRRLRARKSITRDGHGAAPGVMEPESPETFDELSAEAERMGAKLRRCADRDNFYELETPGGRGGRGRVRRCDLGKARLFLKEEADRRAETAAFLASLEHEKAPESTTTGNDVKGEEKQAPIETAKPEPRHHKAVMVSVERHDNVVDTAVTLSHQGTDIHSLTDLSREQRNDVISLLQEMQATIFSAISRLRDTGEQPPTTPTNPGPAPDGATEEEADCSDCGGTGTCPDCGGTGEQPAETVPSNETVTEAKVDAGTIEMAPIDRSLDIPDPLIQAARQRHPIASAPQDTPLPITPPSPAPAPSPPTSPSPKLKVSPHYLPAHQDPWPKDWKSLNTTALADVISKTQAFGINHRLEDRHHKQLARMRERLEVLKANRAERPQANAEVPVS
jgi:hypothetical protein